MRALPGVIVSKFVPSPESWLLTEALAPWPSATMAITAATPMMMPSVVSTLRPLLARSAASAEGIVWKRRSPPLPRAGTSARSANGSLFSGCGAGVCRSRTAVPLAGGWSITWVSSTMKVAISYVLQPGRHRVRRRLALGHRVRRRLALGHRVRRRLALGHRVRRAGRAWLTAGGCALAGPCALAAGGAAWCAAAKSKDVAVAASGRTARRRATSCGTCHDLVAGLHTTDDDRSGAVAAAELDGHAHGCAVAQDDEETLLSRRGLCLDALACCCLRLALTRSAALSALRRRCLCVAALAGRSALSRTALASLSRTALASLSRTARALAAAGRAIRALTRGASSGEALSTAALARRRASALRVACLARGASSRRSPVHLDPLDPPPRPGRRAPGRPQHRPDPPAPRSAPRPARR